MPAPILHEGALVFCSHLAPADPNAPVARVTVAGKAVVTMSPPYTITGCPFTSPCVTGQWMSGATRVKVTGDPVAIQSGNSTSTPNATPMAPLVVQSRVLAS